MTVSIDLALELRIQHSLMWFEKKERLKLFEEMESLLLGGAEKYLLA